MQCNNGIYIKSQDIIAPCGQCMPCRINKGRNWTARILMEQVTTPQYSWFVTLTYNDDHLPQTLDDDGAPVPTLAKKEFLKWVNNTMRTTGSYRYYAVGEYGDLRGRPHYHMAIFPQSFEQVSEISALWDQGFSSISEITTERARYLARYTAKKLSQADDHRLRGNQQPEFRTSSRRPPLGATFVENTISQYQTAKGSKIIAQRGDVERIFRFQNKTYPIGGWALGKIREELGIPLLHRDRIAAHPEYLKWHQLQEAKQDPKARKGQETRINGKKTQSLYRGSARL